MNREIMKIARDGQRYLKQAYNNNELGLGEYESVHIIRHNVGISLKQLAEKAQRDKAAITREIRSLEKKGYVEVRNNPLDGRSKQIFPTKKAQQVKVSNQQIEEHFYNWLYEEFDEMELEQFQYLINKLYRRSKQARINGFQELNCRYEKK